MRRPHLKKLSVLALIVLQLGAPVLGISLELACNEKPAQACKPMPCCQAETSARMTCCETSAPAKGETMPAAVVTPVRIHYDLAAPLPFVTANATADVSTAREFTFSTSTTHFTDNKLYKLLATFLI